MGINFKIDEEKCIHCGLCIKDCMAKIITFNENKIPTTILEREQNCIKCQHCLSICPTGALSVLDKNPDESELMQEFFNPNEILKLIKARRSVRHYKKENVSKENIDKLKEMLSFVPTGVNNHGLYFSVIEDKEVMDKFRDKTNKTIIKIIENRSMKMFAKKFQRYTQAILNNEDIIFRGAPHMIVVSAPKNSPCKDIDPTIALSYFELLAKSLGVGTCWCGLAYYCLKFIPHLKDSFKIPKTHEISYVMLFGYPEVNYKRETQPEPSPVFSVTEIDEKDCFDFFSKIKSFFSK